MAAPDEPPSEDRSFPRGGRGPPQPLPRGANLLLLLVSLAVLGAVLAFGAWLFL